MRILFLRILPFTKNILLNFIKDIFPKDIDMIKHKCIITKLLNGYNFLSECVSKNYKTSLGVIRTWLLLQRESWRNQFL